MSSPRLPVVGRPPSSEEVPELGERAPCEEPTVVVIGATATVSSAPFVQALREALAERSLAVAVETSVERLYACRPRLAILISGGLRAVAWEPRVRALEGAFDLVLTEPRPAVARGIAARW